MPRFRPAPSASAPCRHTPCSAKPVVLNTAAPLSRTGTPAGRKEHAGEQTAMKHASIREVFDYWNQRRGTRAAPDRNDIEPGGIRRVLADTFILAFDAPLGHPFRIAGTRVCAAFGRELKGESFVGLWADQSRRLIQEIVTVATDESVGVVAAARGTSPEGTLDFELVILPLSHRGRTDARVLGALAPVEVPYWIGSSALGPLTLGTHRYLGPSIIQPAAPRIAAALPDSRVRRGLVVYDGGQS